MTFTYDYRDKTGAKKSSVIEAQNREDCFAKLRAQGISPMSVREGGKLPSPNRGGMPSAEGKRPNGVIKGILAGVLVIVLAVVTYLFVFQSKPEPVKPPKVPLKKVEPVNKPEPEKKQSVKRTEKMAALTNNVPAIEKPKVPWSNIYTNGRGEEVRVEKDGTKVTMFKAWQKKKEEAKLHPVKRVFRHETEAYMALFLNPAQAVPPPPDNYTNEQVEQMLADQIEILPDDTEDEIRQKEGVKQFKEELREYIKQGGTFNGYLAELEKRQNMEAGKMFEARKMISEAIEKGNMEEAKELYDAINKHFAEQSMPPVNVAPKYRKLLNPPKKKK